MAKSRKDIQIEGQLSLFEFLKPECKDSKEPEVQESFMNEPIYPLDIRGICDDPYCPNCGRGFWTERKKSEVDCERCPDCHIKIDWSLWHRLNDEE